MAESVKELIGKRIPLVKQAEALNNRVAEEGREFNSEEQSEYDKLWADIEPLNSKIQALALADERKVKLAALANEPIPRQTEFMGGANSRTDRVGGLSDESLSKAWGDWLRKGEHCGIDSRQTLGSLRAEQEKLGLYAGSGASGGYLIPPQQFLNTLIKAVDNAVVMRQLAQVFPVNGVESLGAPALTADPDDADWTTELLTGNEDTSMAFGKRELRPHPFAKRIKISKTLIGQSALPIETLVTQRLAYKFGVTEEQAYMTGNGNQKPLGVFTASTDGISTGRDVSTGNTSTAVKFDGLVNALFTLKPQYMQSPSLRMICHRDLIKNLRKEKDGNGQMLWEPSTQVGTPDRIFGVPYTMSEYAPNTFTSGLYVAVIGDFSWYWIADATALMDMQRLVELYALTNQIAYIGRRHVDGMPVLEEAFVRVKLG